MFKKLIQVILLLLTVNFSCGVLAKAGPVSASHSPALLSHYHDLSKHTYGALTVSDATAQPITICSGANITIYGDSSSSGDTYVWQTQRADGTWGPAPVTSGNSYTGANFPVSGLTNNATDNSTVLYHLRRQVTSGGTVTYDSVYDVTVQPSNPITNNSIGPPPVTSFCSSGTVGTLTGSTPSGGSGGLNYQWQSSTDGTTFTNIANQASKDLTPGSISATTYYRRVVSSNNCITPTTSNVITVTVLPAVTNYDINPPGTTEFCASGNPGVLTGNTPSGGSGTYVYQWQNSSDNVTFTNISGANTKDYDPPTINSTTYYRRVVSSGACSGPYISSVVTIIIDQPVANNSVTVPAQTTFCVSGTPGTLTGTTPTGGNNGSYTYQWQSSADGVTFTDIAGATSKDYAVPSVSSTTYFRREVTGVGCQLPPPSNVIKVTIQQAITNNTITPPVTTTFCGSGTPGVMTGNVPSGGSGTFAYQWQSSTDGTTFTDIANATGQSYTPASPISQTTTFRRMATSGACTAPQASNTVTVTIQQAITSNTITAPSVSNVCGAGTPGTITGSSAQGGNGVFVYQWQSSTDNSTFSDITGANGQSYTPPATLGTIYYRRTVSSGACSTPQPTASVTITVQNAISNNTINPPGVTTFCGSGTPGVMTGNVPSGGSGTFTYQWQSSTDGTNFTDLTGATTQNYTPSTPVSQTTTYRRMAVSGVCTTPQPSNLVVITIQQAITNNSISAPSVSNICGPGTPGTITGSIAQGGSGTFSYQWQSSSDNVNFTNIAGANAPDYTPPATQGTIYYRRTVTSGACSTPQSTASVAITIQQAISNNIITAPATATFCGPNTPGIITGNVPSGGSGTFTYQWQSSTDGTSFNDISGATGENYTPSAPVNQTTTFRRMAVSGVCTTPQPSNLVIITIQQAITNNTITAPSVTNICGSASPGTITGSAAQGGSGTFSYQWQSSTDNVNFTNITGATGQDYTPPGTLGTIYYRRTVTSGSCSVPQATASVSISIQSTITNNTVTPPTVVSLCGPGIPGTITGSVPSGGSGTFSYQWQSSTDGTTFTDITGATGKDYVPTAALSQNTTFRRMVTSGNCQVPVPSSNTVLITIKADITNNTITAPSVTNFCGTGTPPSTIIGSTPAGGDNTFSYQWQSSTDGSNFTDITGATGRDYTPPATIGSIYYRRTVSSGPCTTPKPTSAVLIVIQAPITSNNLTPPATTAFCGPAVPGTITGSVPSGGSGSFTYQWQSSINGTNFTDIANATNKDYTPSTLSQTTTYRRVVISGNCQTPSISANTITITINNQLSNNNLTAPNVTSFCVSGSPGVILGSVPVGGNGTYAYQWQSSTDNVTFSNIAGANTPDYTPPTISVTTYYRRIVTSGPCSTPYPSGSIAITITPLPPVPVLAATVVPNCLGASATLSVSSPQSGITYNWYDSPAKINLLHTGSVYVTQPLTSNTVFYVESSNGVCANSTLSSVQVNIVTLPATPVVTQNAVSTCSGTSAVLSVGSPQAGITYNWYTSATGGTSVSSGTTFTTPTLSATTTYYLEAVNSAGCPSPSRAAAVVTVMPLPNVSAQGTSICPGSTTTLNATPNVSGAIINWYTSASATTPVYTGSAFTTPALNSNTTYYVEAVNSSTGCASARLAVQVGMIQPLAAPVVTVETSTISSVTFKWSAVSGATSYLVSIDNGQTFISPSSGGNGLTQVVTGLAENSFVTIIVKAIGNSPCETSANSQAVTGQAQSLTDDIFVPNAFTPNGDGKNDAVYVHSEGIKSMVLNIYDQWGELLFVSNDKLSGWDGTYKGNKEPVGVYVYYLKAVMNNGHEVNKKGTITLLR